MSTNAKPLAPRNAEAALALIHAMSTPERRRLFKALEGRPGLMKAAGYIILPKAVLDFLTKLAKFGRDSHQEAVEALVPLANTLHRRTPKPRNRERDAAIVRLRDQQGMAFGRIPGELLRLNAGWGGDDGSRLSREAVEKAYKRFKGKKRG